MPQCSQKIFDKVTRRQRKCRNKSHANKYCSIHGKKIGGGLGEIDNQSDIIFKSMPLSGVANLIKTNKNLSNQGTKFLLRILRNALINNESSINNKNIYNDWFKNLQEKENYLLDKSVPLFYRKLMHIFINQLIQEDEITNFSHVKQDIFWWNEKTNPTPKDYQAFDFDSMFINSRPIINNAVANTHELIIKILSKSLGLETIIFSNHPLVIEDYLDAEKAWHIYSDWEGKYLTVWVEKNVSIYDNGMDGLSSRSVTIEPAQKYIFIVRPSLIPEFNRKIISRKIKDCSVKDNIEINTREVKKYTSVTQKIPFSK